MRIRSGPVNGSHIVQWTLPGLTAIALLACGEPPSDAVARLKQVFATRPVVADADNAFFDVLGFLAPAGTDPHELGMRRATWLENARAASGDLSPDPGQPALAVRTQRSQILSQVVDACRAAIARACASALERVDDEPLSGVETLLLARYEVLLGRRGWFEIGTTHPENPLPAFDGTIEAQRLLLIRLRRAAAAGDAAQVRATLDRDLAFWRMALESSDVMISKMIALAAIRQHFSFASYVLRELPAERVAEAIPAPWNQEFTAAERSLLRVMAGELLLAEEMLAAEGSSGYARLDESEDERMAPLERLRDRLTSRARRQPDLRDIADEYLSGAMSFAVPLRQYESVSAKIGGKYADSDAGWDVPEYAMRIGSAEGMRRAALLTAQLRSQSVPVAQLPDRLKSSPLRNPYNEQPFVWDPADRAIVFTGPEKRKWSRQAYPY